MDEKILEERRRVLRIIREERERNDTKPLVDSLLVRLMNRIISECDDPPTREEFPRLFDQA
jgi:hypothetical protein